MILQQVGYHRPLRLPSLLHGSHISLASGYSFPPPFSTLPWLGGGYLGPPRRKMCCNWGIAGGLCSPISGPLSCPALISAQSGPVGRSDLRPYPCTPPQGILLLLFSEGMISGMSGSRLGGGAGVPTRSLFTTPC